MRILWQQAHAFLARRIRYKITRGGALFTFAMLLVTFGAIVSANNLLFLILAAMMATLLISGLVSRLCLAGLALDFQVPDHIPAGRTVPARLFVRNHKWILPSFSISVEAIREAGSPTMNSGVYFPLSSPAPPSTPSSTSAFPAAAPTARTASPSPLPSPSASSKRPLASP